MFWQVSVDKVNSVISFSKLNQVCCVDNNKWNIVLYNRFCTCPAETFCHALLCWLGWDGAGCVNLGLMLRGGVISIAMDEQMVRRDWERFIKQERGMNKSRSSQPFCVGNDTHTGLLLHAEVCVRACVCVWGLLGNFQVWKWQLVQLKLGVLCINVALWSTHEFVIGFKSVAETYNDWIKCIIRSCLAGRQTKRDSILGRGLKET